MYNSFSFLPPSLRTDLLLGQTLSTKPFVSDTGFCLNYHSSLVWILPGCKKLLPRLCFTKPGPNLS